MIASYLSVNAPIKDNWEELFLENWNKSPYPDDSEIETWIDKVIQCGSIRILCPIQVKKTIFHS